MAEKKLEELKIEVNNLKVSLYSLIEGYRKLIHISQMEPNKLIPLCKITTSIVDEKGIIMVGNEVLDTLKEKIIAKCLKECDNYINLFYSVDKFIMEMMEYVDIVKSSYFFKDENFLLLSKCWCGDKYEGQTKQNALRLLTDHFNSLAKNLSIDMFKNLYYEIENDKKEENETIFDFFNLETKHS